MHAQSLLPAREIPTYLRTSKYTSKQLTHTDGTHRHRSAETPSTPRVKGVLADHGVGRAAPLLLLA